MDVEAALIVTCPSADAAVGDQRQHLDRAAHVGVRDPDSFDAFYAGCVRRVTRLHDGRHSALSIMHAPGVPIAIISKWAGHYSAAFTMSVYVHAADSGMSAG